jgi:large subunit ribosomal protein L21
MFAVIELGGHQYLVQKGDMLKAEKVSGVKPGADFKVEKVLLTVDGETVKLGKPYVQGASVSANLVSEAKGRKLVVFRYKPKKRERKLKGHRQTYAQVKILDITA